MKQINKYSFLYYLFTFKLAYSYAFIAGILVALAVNLFTTVLVTKDLLIADWRVHGMVLSFFISSIGAFGISALLEASRSDWERDGAQSDPGIIGKYAVKKNFGWKLSFLFIFIMGLASSILWYSDTLLNYYYQLSKIKG